MSALPPYEELMAGCGILLLQRQDASNYLVAGPFPEWFPVFAPDGLAPRQTFQPGVVFPFLSFFLEDAEAFWAAGKEDKLRSGFWTESPPGEPDMNFEAFACRTGGAEYLLIRRLTTGFDRLQSVFQKGREQSLVHERLISEIGKKEILLHCIIHDISGPLTGMMGALEMAGKEQLSDRGKRMIELGLAAAQKQTHFIANLLDSFQAEAGPSNKTLPDPAQAPDAVACGSEVLATLRPSFEMHDLTGQIRLPPEVTELRVIGERRRLERIFYNLLQNAMRFSPRSSPITISYRLEAEDFVRVSVEDEGPGVSPEVAPQLFQKFVRGNRAGGKAGLGLFFCRITVEQWGGAIGCEPRPGGGTSFWFRLKRV